LLLVFLLLIIACAPVKKPLDERVGFSRYLQETENYIRQDDWKNAAQSLKQAQQSWKKVKPFLQIDIDHDYVNDIEGNFILLKGYIETEEKPDSLSLIMLIRDLWKNIGEM
jgi:hypothetical protein